jgi:aryl-alcohol dehydrogenase-like predicted oxidoreductase
MKYRAPGRTDWKVSEVSFGASAIGGAWGVQPIYDEKIRPMVQQRW